MEMSLSKLLEDSGQGSLAYCSPWEHKVWYDLATEQLGKRLEVVVKVASCSDGPYDHRREGVETA